ncbi:hypothetical protein F7725_003666 [Dissostichus mawsoni]|uniref:Uncharacterized protein n=1 Tax=Dissostichus mawsoni TaxID=36200 RepID=A0A7J5YE77_DISMA|nr:hypothetical protein F7725_003666 [Dissostichus mawsoni]
MSKSPPPVAPRKHSGVRVMMVPGDQPPAVLPVYTDFGKGASGESNYTSLLNAERELEIMNHCFDDVERFMTRLQQTAEAQSVLNQRGKTRSRKSKKKKDDQVDDLLTLKALPPSEEEFVDIFQKIKYSLGLLDRLKSSITQPNAPELLHPIFLPLGLMVKTTGGPALGASVVSPAMTSGAVSLIQDHLNEEEKKISHLSVSVPPYSPVFLDGWQPQAYDSTGQLFEDPIESQHKQDAFSESRGGHSLQERARQTAEGPGEDSYEGYDFVARNSSELSVLQGETLETLRVSDPAVKVDTFLERIIELERCFSQVIESSKRWWKCRNRFDQIGFVPFNILEPLSALNHKGRASPVLRSESKKTALTPRTKYFSYAAPSPSGTSPTHTRPMRPHSMVLPSTTMQGEDHDRVMIMNDELMQRTVQILGILNGAQLFSLNKEELRTVSSEEGVRVYSQIMVQKSLLEDVRKSTELETRWRSRR